MIAETNRFLLCRECRFHSMPRSFPRSAIAVPHTQSEIAGIIDAVREAWVDGGWLCNSARSRAPRGGTLPCRLLWLAFSRWRSREPRRPDAGPPKRTSPRRSRAGSLSRSRARRTAAAGAQPEKANPETTAGAAGERGQPGEACGLSRSTTKPPEGIEVITVEARPARALGGAGVRLGHAVRPGGARGAGRAEHRRSGARDAQSGDQIPHRHHTHVLHPRSGAQRFQRERGGRRRHLQRRCADQCARPPARSALRRPDRRHHPGSRGVTATPATHPAGVIRTLTREPTGEYEASAALGLRNQPQHAGLRGCARGPDRLQLALGARRLPLDADGPLLPESLRQS